MSSHCAGCSISRGKTTASRHKCALSPSARPLGTTYAYACQWCARSRPTNLTRNATSFECVQPVSKEERGGEGRGERETEGEGGTRREREIRVGGTSFRGNGPSKKNALRL